MDKKILVFDPEVVCHESLLRFLRLEFNNPSLTLTATIDMVEFERFLYNSKPWDIVIINFWTAWFWDMDFNEIISFIEKVKKSQDPDFIFIGITPDSYQKNKLEKNDIVILFKSIGSNQLGKILKNSSRKTGTVTIESIQKMVCEDLYVPYERVQQRTRKREVVLARQAIMFLAKMFTRNSLKTIGEHFGGRDHTTVIHSCQTVKDLMDTDIGFKNTMVLFMDKIEALL